MVTFAQTDTVLTKKARLITVITTESVLYNASILGLNELWYKNYPRSGFHTFDDSQEWLQMDKAGHVVTSYYIGRIGFELLKWSGVEHKKAVWFGGTVGFFYQSTIEVLDGFSTQWGFSWSDMGANTLGTALFIGQEFAWQEQRLCLKYSFHQTSFPSYRPNVLGKSLIEQVLKDYNGQTYWLSVNLASFMNKETRFPKWLNVALGYGAEGMTGANANLKVNTDGTVLPVFDRYRKFYFSLDIDLTRIKTNSDWLKLLFHTIGFLKIPAPAVEFSEKGVSFSPIYY